jgi:LysM repeat protein
MLGWGLLMLVGCRPSDEILLDDKRNPYVKDGNQRRAGSDLDGAIAAYERALKVNPYSVRAHYELGMLYQNHKNDYVTAIYHYNQVLKIQKDGYPVAQVKSLIGGCRQELVKKEVLAPVTQEMQRELENLRQENHRLQEELAALKTTLANNPSSSEPASIASPPSRTQAARAAPPSPSSRSPAAPSPRTRTHRVRPGETMAAISRAYKVSLKALLDANPNIQPETMPVGTVVRIPRP